VETITLSAIVSADYSQFYLHISDPSLPPPANGPDVGIYDTDPGASIAFFTAPADLLLTVGRQLGELPVTVNVHSQRPKPLDALWRDVVELSVLASGPLTLTGWEPRGDESALPVDTGKWYRLRYAISDMDLARQEESVVENYLVEFWPEAQSPAATIAANTENGRYWRRARFLEVLRWEIHGRPFEVTEHERVAEFANRAFDAFPDLSASVLSDPQAARRLAGTALVVKAIDWGEVRRLIRAGGEAQATNHEATMSRITAQLIDIAGSRT
jgi:hypothetical protein